MATKPKPETNEKTEPKTGENPPVEARDETATPPEARRETPTVREPVQRQPDERPGVGMRESDDLPPVRTTGRRFTPEALLRNAEDIAEHFGEDLPKLVAQLAGTVGMKLIPSDGKGKTHTGKFIAKVGLRVQPKGEEKVRTVKAGEIILLSDEDAKFFFKKDRIAPELV